MSEEDLTSLKQRVNELTVSLDAAYKELDVVCKELFETRAKLKTYQEGIPVEDADKNKFYLCYPSDWGEPSIARYSLGSWEYLHPNCDYTEFKDTRLYPLPQQKGGE